MKEVDITVENGRACVDWADEDIKVNIYNADLDERQSYTFPLEEEEDEDEWSPFDEDWDEDEDLLEDLFDEQDELDEEDL